MLFLVMYPQSLACIQESQDSDAFHHACGGVAKKLAPLPQCAVDPVVVLGSHEDVLGLGWGTRCLLGDVVALGAIGVVPVAGEDFTQDGVQWLLYASATHQSLSSAGLGSLSHTGA